MAGRLNVTDGGSVLFCTSLGFLHEHNVNSVGFEEAGEVGRTVFTHQTPISAQSHAAT